MNKLIPRPQYLESLINLRGADVFKVIAGVRRCGKSTLFDLYIKYLKTDGVDENQIIRIDLEDAAMEHLHNHTAMLEFLMPKIHNDKMTYIFIDEIGWSEGFEKMIDTISALNNTDVYLSSSNAALAKTLSELMPGRYAEIKMLPLSFAEFYAISNNSDKNQVFMNYLNAGGFPLTAARLGSNTALSAQYSEGVYNTIFVNDLLACKGVNDIHLLKSIVNYLCSNIGNLISTADITKHINNSGRKTKPKTVKKYIKALTDSFLFYHARRHAVIKVVLYSPEKYYIADTGFCNDLLLASAPSVVGQLENIVYLELRRRGYQVSIGHIFQLSIDFIAVKQNIMEYYQVSASALDESVQTSKLDSLRKIDDKDSKYLLTLDPTAGEYEGIKQVNLIDWLLM